MILIDTSAWVDYLRGADTAATREVRRLADEAFDDLVTCEPVAMELLAGAPHENALRDLERLVNSLPSLPLDATTDFRAAGHLFRLARQAGHTVRSLNDCLIATLALRHSATLVHKDRDFGAVASVCGLKTISLR